MNNTNESDRELVMTRVINAPRELVYNVWTSPEHVAKWWGPNGFTNTITSMDVRPGGIWLFIMHGPDGHDYPNKIEYKEVVEHERLQYHHSSGLENDDEGFDVTVTFETENTKTKLTMRMVFKSKDARDLVVEKYGAIEGNRQTLNRLEEYLEQNMSALS